MPQKGTPRNIVDNDKPGCSFLSNVSMFRIAFSMNLDEGPEAYRRSSQVSLELLIHVTTKRCTFSRLESLCQIETLISVIWSRRNVSHKILVGPGGCRRLVLIFVRCDSIRLYRIVGIVLFSIKRCEVESLLGIELSLLLLNLRTTTNSCRGRLGPRRFQASREKRVK